MYVNFMFISGAGFVQATQAGAFMPGFGGAELKMTPTKPFPMPESPMEPTSVVANQGSPPCTPVSHIIPSLSSMSLGAALPTQDYLLRAPTLKLGDTDQKTPVDTQIEASPVHTVASTPREFHIDNQEGLSPVPTPGESQAVTQPSPLGTTAPEQPQGITPQQATVGTPSGVGTTTGSAQEKASSVHTVASMPRELHIDNQKGLSPVPTPGESQAVTQPPPLGTTAPEQPQGITPQQETAGTPSGLGTTTGSAQETVGTPLGVGTTTGPAQETVGTPSGEGTTTGSAGAPTVPAVSNGGGKKDKTKYSDGTYWKILGCSLRQQ